MQADVILFGEPTSALDPEPVGEVLATIRSRAEEKRTIRNRHPRDELRPRRGHRAIPG
ncbi:hypothetical protein [Pseudomonas sp. PDM14]|uniref:hypothetical protein n=1 Tax=Pseudomonas sp. PDM14 TaxID=2769288 RepID=UPI0039999B98